jgi:hypothetical protein
MNTECFEICWMLEFGWSLGVNEWAIIGSECLHMIELY